MKSAIDQLEIKLKTDEDIQLNDRLNNDPHETKDRRSFTDDDSGFSDVTTVSECTSPIQTITEEDYELASAIPDESKKEFCSDMCFVFHAEFQLTFGRYFHSDSWLLMPIGVDGKCRLPSNTECDVEIAKVRFECDSCGHCWTSMRGQISFFYDVSNHILYFKLFGQNCDRCQNSCSPLWYPDEVCRVMKNVFVVINQQVYPDLETPIKPNHYRRLGNPKGQHHGCESCRDGVCVALAAQQMGCKLLK